MTTSDKPIPTTESSATRATVQAFVAQVDSPAPTKTMLVVGSETATARLATTLAGDLQRALVRVPLSSVVSNNPGETEKHLDQVFAAASKSGSVLLFDEADALFAERTDVKDSHDRYANVAVAGLLQRIEAHPGVTIVASRTKTNLDGAFTRRLASVTRVELPD